VVAGDLGRSFKSGRPVTTEIAARYGHTVALTLVSVLLAGLVGVPAGLLAASRHGRAADRATMLLALFGVCVPAFWLGLMLQLLLSVQLGWLPTAGAGTWRHLVAPSLTLAAFAVANFTRSWRCWTRTTCAPRAAKASPSGGPSSCTRCGTRCCPW
jgi:ABC-type dipeptide/oligopeptide/nickel transport system permease component